MDENLNAPESSGDHLHDSSEVPPRDPPSEASETQVDPSDREPQPRTDPTSNPVSRSPDEPVNGEESS